MDKIRVFLVDDQIFFTEGLKRVLESEEGIEIVGQCNDGKIAVQRISEILPDIVLMDITLPNLDGIEATRLVKKQNPGVHIIMLTISDDPQSVFPAIKAGAMGYLLKDETPQELIRAIRTVHAGEALLSSRIASILLREFSQLFEEGRGYAREIPKDAVFDNLTNREVEVLTLVADGLSNKEISKKLLIAERTVKNHISNIFQKLHVNDRTQAVVVALQQKIIP
ncbi:MAG: response regulator transcription factor [Armatimonadetes bacterium]|nr:response regulator transcription factor [Armatimonadota bacterium]